ncbi:M15 family metallopeptidase [Paenibacillus odorifer]|uniref:M15 family metallopeptidase n=1 Tax=Paenibacillus odorifer TaxID=189426 RepID=UPI00096E4014|nr:M15 family metallopeptidase [Paenibacillus odorifer]OME59494.1 peptidase M15 [Paenibacillus odorifer]
MLTLDQVKSKSSARLIGLHPIVLAAATVLIERCYARGVPIVITQGLRTIAEQDALYAQGRAKPGSIVTNAKGGYSYHNFGLAVDFALLLPNGSSVSWDMNRDYNGNNIKDWIEVVEEAKKLGFDWGGDWTSFKDYPHFQMVFGLTLTQLRAGSKPSETAMAKASAIIDRLKGEAEEDMSRIAELEEQVKELAKVVSGLTNSKDVLKQAATEQGLSIAKVLCRVDKLEGKARLTEIPAWANDAVQAAFDAGLIDTPTGGSLDFYRVITVLARAGLLITRLEDK